MDGMHYYKMNQQYIQEPLWTSSTQPKQQ